MKSVFNYQVLVSMTRKIASLFSASRGKASPQTIRGFSLIELLVSMALFIVVITIGIGALMVLINANSKAQNIQSSVSNIQFALDSMAREIRTGNGYYCTSGSDEATGDYTQVKDCNKGQYISVVEGGKSLSEGANNRRIAYRFNAVDGSIERKIGSGNWVRLTDPSVEIIQMHINVANSAAKEVSSDTLQPNATIYISGQVTGIDDSSTDFTIQTTVTQRTLDI